MLPFISKIFDSNEKQLQRVKPLVAEINAFEEATKKLKDKDFPKKTQEFKTRIKDGESLDLLLPEAFALIREASNRVLGFKHFDVQLVSAISLYQGKISEQKTGEGKTLSAIPALYLHSLTGNNVHLVTVNDYLARRDAGWMGPVFHFLGISVASIISEQSFVYDPEFTNDTVSDFRLVHLRPITRQEAYKADIVYGINSEFGFDYLRDNMVSDATRLSQRGHYFAVVDEVDSVLIDEARTPHIISAPDTKPSEKYYEYAKLVDKLSPDTDYKIDEKLKTAHLTDHGIAKIEKLYNVPNIYEKDFDTVYHLEAALKARTLFHKEKDYIVKDNQVILVDEFTGRLLEGRRLSEGLHQAIEAKESVSIQRESKTLATVSLQNYFRMYKVLSGMTGTAVTEAEEFHKIYKLDTVVVPTNRVMTRVDMADVIYKTGRAKYTAVADTIEKAHKIGQPVLVGTTSIEKNEIISELLHRRGIKHEVLNAKNHMSEAQIISAAGVKGAVTVATNMAGRGVDIILGGESPKAADGSTKQNSPEWKKWEKDHSEVVSLGGLFVIGTERHESRRIDNQLRGRSGRQGDPGTSQFFVSLDDDVMRLFGGDTIAGVMTRFNMPEDVPLTHAIVTRAIEQAQVKVEGFNFDIRKHLVEYDDVLNKQREIIYATRRKILLGQDTNQTVLNKIEDTLASLTTMYSSDLLDDEGGAQKLVEEFSTIIPFDDASREQLVKQLIQLQSVTEKIDFLSKLAADIYKKREDNLGEKIARDIEKFVTLSAIDRLWMDHLDAIDNLRGGIGLRGYGQRDPLVEYKNEAYKMFEQLLAAIDDEIVHTIYKVQVEQAPMPVVDESQIITNTPESEISEPKKPTTKTLRPAVDGSLSTVDKKKLGRNDLCYCGSGKKFKKCHGK